MKITKEIFNQQRSPRFWHGNPERMRLEFWEWMIRGEEYPPADKENGLVGVGFVMREGKLKPGLRPLPRPRSLSRLV